jgi:serralysin
MEAADGGSGDDTLVGNAAGNIFFGGRGKDHLDGRAGPDQLFGEQNGDRVKGGKGTDQMSGGPGPDVLLARDGKRDRVSGGKGHDIATVDRHDRVFSVEHVRR